MNEEEKNSKSQNKEILEKLDQIQKRNRAGDFICLISVGVVIVIIILIVWAFNNVWS